MVPVCDTLRLSQLAFRTEDESGYLMLPKLVTCVNQRHDIGAALLQMEQNKQLAANLVEVCWMFHLTREKYRLRCLPKIIQTPPTSKKNGGTADEKSTLNESDSKIL